MPNSKIDAHDLTVYPKGIDNYDKLNEFETYNNSEFDSEQNHTNTMKGLQKLKTLNNKNGQNEVFIVVFNEDTPDEPQAKPIRKLDDSERVYNFMFDYALTGLSTDDQLWIHYYIMKYRFISFEDKRSDLVWADKKMLAQVFYGVFMDKNKINHIRGIWS